MKRDDVIPLLGSESDRDLADRFGLDPSYVSKLRRDRNIPRWTHKQPLDRPIVFTGVAPAKYYGRLCPRGHDHGGGRSAMTEHGCVECAHEWYRSRHAPMSEKWAIYGEPCTHGNKAAECRECRRASSTKYRRSRKGRKAQASAYARQQADPAFRAAAKRRLKKWRDENPEKRLEQSTRASLKRRGVPAPLVPVARSQRTVARIITELRDRIDWAAVPLGQVSDTVIAADLGVPFYVVKKERRRRKIPGHLGHWNRFDWSAVPLGRVPDRVLARQLGTNVSMICKHRLLLGIEPPERKKK